MSDPTPGRTSWAFSAGHLPLRSTGHEPEFTGRDELCLLNTTDRDSRAQITIYRTDQEPIGPFEIVVGARRVRHVRINDLIDPQPIPLAVPYGMTVVSDMPLVLQVKHVDTSQAALGVAISSGLPGDG